VAANEANIFEFFTLRRDWPQTEFHDGPELMWSRTSIRFRLFNAFCAPGSRRSLIPLPASPKPGRSGSGEAAGMRQNPWPVDALSRRVYNPRNSIADCDREE